MNAIRASILALAAVLAIAGTTTAAGQLLPPVARGVLRPLGTLGETIRDTAGQLTETLAAARLDRFARLAREHPAEIALDPLGNPSRAGELIVNDPPPAFVAAAMSRGFRLIDQGMLLGVGYARFATPARVGLKQAIKQLRKLGAADVTADQLHFESGAASVGPGGIDSGDGPAVGVIDGGVAGPGVMQRGFASGAPRPSDHGAAVASLIAGGGRVRGAAPGARLYVADVYGADPAGGSASAIAKALAWLVEARVPVVSISLVGPPNPLLARVIAAAQARGCIIVAAVGNDGPASPPSYPASYPGVVAVTAVDGRDRVLIEAGRATHLDYAAPGADMLAGNAMGGAAAVRGTSFAAPLVAGTIARGYRSQALDKRRDALAAVDAGARRLGPRYGRGLVCADCRTPVR